MARLGGESKGKQNLLFSQAPVGLTLLISLGCH